MPSWLHGQDSIEKIPPRISTAGFSGRSEVTRTPDIMLPNVCLNLQLALLHPLWRFPMLRQFLFDTLSPCLFQENLSSFGICVGLNSVY